MFDRVMRATWRNFSTLVVVAAVVTIPLHVAHAFWFRDVIAVDDLRPYIERAPEGLGIRGVGPGDLDAWRISLWVLTVLEIALVPLAARAAGRVLEVDAAGGVPTAPDAWRAALGRRGVRTGRPDATAVATGAAIAVLVLVLAESAGLIVLDLLPDERVWPVLGVLGGLVRAICVPFVAVPLAFSEPKAKDATLGTPTLR